jgi:thiosulfate/3-mercaptopyruvate sulfurtransferase
MKTLLVTTEELAAHLDDPTWVVFDARHDLADVEKGRREYAAGHIPGAYFLHLDRDLAGEKTGSNGRHPLPAIERFAARMNECGVGAQTQVVAYDDAGGSFAARVWWLLDWLGLERVALLDGGLGAWERDGRPLATAAPAPRPGSFVPRPRLGATVDAHFLERFHGAQAPRLIDARSNARFSGAQEPLDRVPGHIPGAVNRFWQVNLAPDGRFKAAGALREEFAALLGPTPPQLAVNMCGSGVTACHNLFAMALAGLPDARLYPGSWSEWCSDPRRPVAR